MDFLVRDNRKMLALSAGLSAVGQSLGLIKHIFSLSDQVDTDTQPKTDMLSENKQHNGLNEFA